MECFINRELGENAGVAFDDEAFRKRCHFNGDSIIIIADDEVIKGSRAFQDTWGCIKPGSPLWRNHTNSHSQYA